MKYASFRTLVSVAALLLCIPSFASAQSDYPERSLTMIVNISAGSGTDIIARIMAEELKAILKQTVVVENRPGAGGAIGAAAVSAAEPDGYQLLVTSSALTALPAIQPKLAYDTEKDLTPIALLAYLPGVVMISPEKGIRTLGELIDRARLTPDEITFGSSGTGSASHLEVARIAAAAKVKFRHVPYKGAPEAITDTVAGRVDFVVAPLAAGKTFIGSKQLLAIATTGSQRSALIPDVPSINEAGLNIRGGAWIGLLGPKDMPAELVNKLHNSIEQALQSPVVKQRLESMMAEQMSVTPTDFKRLIKEEIAANKDLIEPEPISDK